MKNLKKAVTLVAVVALLGATSAVTFAASPYNSMADIAAALTGKTVTEVQAEKVESGKTYGTLAKDAGKLEEFKAEAVVAKKAILTEKVAAGTMTQEKADQISTAIDERMATCDGTATGNDGTRLGAGFGMGQGNGNGQGQGFGQGCGMGNGGMARGAGNGAGGGFGAGTANCNGACVTE